MNAMKFHESSTFSDVLASTCSQTTASAGSPGAYCSARSAASEIWLSMYSIAIEPVPVDLQLAQVAEDHAGVLARHVAQDHVALRLPRRAAQDDHVADRSVARSAARAPAPTCPRRRRSADGPRAQASYGARLGAELSSDALLLLAARACRRSARRNAGVSIMDDQLLLDEQDAGGRRPPHEALPLARRGPVARVGLLGPDRAAPGQAAQAAASTPPRRPRRSTSSRTSTGWCSRPPGTA